MSEAFCAERIRLLEEALQVAASAFSDALIALRELEQDEVADRLEARWPEVGVTP